MVKRGVRFRSRTTVVGRQRQRCHVIRRARYAARVAEMSIFDTETRQAFAVYLRDNENIRRVTPQDWVDILSWLTDFNRHPSDQAEHSRRHYVRRTFHWDAEGQRLVSVGPSQEKARLVVTTDRILEYVEYVHHNIGHLGWDATWRHISEAYYGILRADVIFLLRRCVVCATNPAKRPKGSTPSSS